MIIDYQNNVNDLLLRTDSRVELFLTSPNWSIEPNLLSRGYQCIFENGKPMFAVGKLKDKAVIDNYKINLKIDNIKKELIDLSFPDNTLLVGELFHPEFDVMTKIISTDTATSLSMQLQQPLKYIVSDIYYFDTISLLSKTYFERRLILEDLFEDTETKLVRLKDHYVLREEKQKYFEQCQTDSQGVLFRNGNVNYYDSKVYRYNNMHTFYAIILDVNIQKGLAYSIKIGMYQRGHLVEVGNATGLSRQYCELLAQNKEQYINKMVRVASRIRVGNKLKNPKLIEICETYSKEKCNW